MRRYGIVLLILAMMLSLTACKAKGNETFDLESIDTQEEAKSSKETNADIYVYVCGAVVQEGVYKSMRLWRWQEDFVRMLPNQR